MPNPLRATPLHLLAAAAMLGILAGCGGSGGASAFPPLTPPPKPPPSDGGFSDLATLAQNLYAEVSPIDETPVANMPTTGKATYSGAVSYVKSEDVPSGLTKQEKIDYLIANPRVVSDVNMTADFASSTVSGTFANYVDRSTGPWQGEMTMSNGTISDNGFKADVSGSIGLAGAQQPSSGTADGKFGGTSAQYVAGSVLVDVGPASPGSQLVGVMVGKQ